MWANAAICWSLIHCFSASAAKTMQAWLLSNVWNDRAKQENNIDDIFWSLKLKYIPFNTLFPFFPVLWALSDLCSVDYINLHSPYDTQASSIIFAKFIWLFVSHVSPLQSCRWFTKRKGSYTRGLTCWMKFIQRPVRVWIPSSGCRTAPTGF